MLTLSKLHGNLAVCIALHLRISYKPDFLQTSNPEEGILATFTRIKQELSLFKLNKLMWTSSPKAHVN